MRLKFLIRLVSINQFNVNAYVSLGRRLYVVIGRGSVSLRKKVFFSPRRHGVVALLLKTKAKALTTTKTLSLFLALNSAPIDAKFIIIIGVSR